MERSIEDMELSKIPQFLKTMKNLSFGSALIALVLLISSPALGCSRKNKDYPPRTCQNYYDQEDREIVVPEEECKKYIDLSFKIDELTDKLRAKKEPEKVDDLFKGPLRKPGTGTVAYIRDKDVRNWWVIIYENPQLNYSVSINTDNVCNITGVQSFFKVGLKELYIEKAVNANGKKVNFVVTYVWNNKGERVRRAPLTPAEIAAFAAALEDWKKVVNSL